MSHSNESVRAHMPGLPFGAGRAPLGDPEEVRREMSAAALSKRPHLN